MKRGYTRARSTFGWYFFIFSILVGCERSRSSSTPASSEDPLPNFIFILVDDQGWNGTSVQMQPGKAYSASDYHETPNLERLAHNGRRFSQAYSAAPVCAPSRYSLQLGKSPARLSLIRVGMNTEHIDHESEVSIPKALKACNTKYVSAHYGKWGMGSDPKTLGFAHSDGATQNKTGGFVNNPQQWECTHVEDPKKVFSLTKKAIAFINERVDREEPFFLQISHYAVHSSIQSRRETSDKFKGKVIGDQHTDVGFAAMTFDLDKSLGMLMDHVERLDIAENTFIIYMSDNGAVPNIPGARKYERSYNYPLARGKWDAMEGGLRVPLIVCGPGIEAGSVCNIPVGGADLLPTIVSLAGGDPNRLRDLDGGSLKAALYDDNVRSIIRSVRGLYFHVPYRNSIALRRPHSAVRIGDMKLLKFQDTGEIKLFDLTNDLAEMTDLSDSLPLAAQLLTTNLDNYLHGVRALKWQEGITWKNKPLSEINSYH